uniref:G protein-coupled receptor n=1 Tax=Panagrellus redivivus TaxID=6233 RepID=A0A7E4VNN3_PANRE
MFNSMGNTSTMTTWRCETVQQFSENGYYKAVMLFKVCMHVSGISLMMFDCRAKISLSFTINFYFKIYGVDLSTFYVSSVESVIYDGDGYEVFIFVIAGLEVILILLFALIWLWNRQLRRQGRSYQLSLKYQINQTIKVVACFFPVVTAHFLLNVWNLAVSYFIPQVWFFDVRSSMN